MAPKYRLTYFNSRGYAETARMLFALAGVEYEDRRMTREEWPDIKPTTPFGQVPMLEVDDFQISQTSAIYRYLGRKFGFAGSTLEEDACLDMITDCIKDMAQALVKVIFEKDEEKKAQLKKDLVENSLPLQMEKMNAFIGDKKFFNGDKISYADVVFFNSMPAYKYIEVDLPYDKYPALKQLQDRVGAEPKIAEWIKKRPATDM